MGRVRGSGRYVAGTKGWRAEIVTVDRLYIPRQSAANHACTRRLLEERYQCVVRPAPRWRLREGDRITQQTFNGLNAQQMHQQLQQLRQAWEQAQQNTQNQQAPSGWPVVARHITWKGIPVPGPNQPPPGRPSNTGGPPGWGSTGTTSGGTWVSDNTATGNSSEFITGLKKLFNVGG